jgi:hypothetical protein
VRLAAPVAGLGLLALPRVAAACATCISSPFGDRSYNLAYLGLILTPFAVALVVGAVLTGAWWHARRRARAATTDPWFNEETR